MPQSLVQNYQHIVFSTKGRQPFLKDSSSRLMMHRYLALVCIDMDSPPIQIGGVDDHVHIFCRLSKSILLTTFLKQLKTESSKWAKRELPACERFYWQGGYGAFSVSGSHVENLIRYIASQDEHHRTVTFQDEFRRLLGLYGLEYDERYVWD